MKYRLWNLTVLAAGGVLFRICVTTNFWQCPIRVRTGLNCPTCGMTGAFRAMLGLDFTAAVRHNLFALPVALVLTAAVFALLWGIVRNRDVFGPLFSFLQKYYKAAFAGVIVMFIVNNLSV